MNTTHVNPEEIRKIQDTTRILINVLIDCSLRKSYAEQLKVLKPNERYSAYGYKGRELEGIIGLRYIIYLDYIQSLMNMVFDSDDRVSSIKNIAEKLKKKEIKEYFLEERNKTKIDYSILPNENAEYNESDEYWDAFLQQQQWQHYIDLYNNIIKNYSIIESNSRFHELKSIRDKIVSHYEISRKDDTARLYQIDDMDISWNDIEKLYEIANKLIIDVYGFIFGSYYELRNVFKTQNDMACSIINKFQD